MEMQKENVFAKGIYDFKIRRMLRIGGIAFSNIEHNGQQIFGKPIRSYRYENIVPTVARTMIANNFTSASPTNVMKITHGALGSGSTTPANADTQLTTETYRNSIASITNAANVAYATAFFSATEVSGTFAEAGIFSNGTGTANSGILISHVLVSITKSSSVTLTLDWSLTFS